jgi:hypothetical protein
MGLSPFLSLEVEKLEAKDTFSELVHHIAPEHGGDFFFLNSKKSIDLGEGC